MPMEHTPVQAPDPAPDGPDHLPLSIIITLMTLAFASAWTALHSCAT